MSVREQTETDSTSLETGALIGGRYEVISLIDRGGFGAVFKARQQSTGQLVAVKILNPERLEDRGKASIETARFQREMKLIAKLKHPNIVRLVDSGELPDGNLFTVLEYIDGETLSTVLEQEVRLDPREAGHLMAQVLDALVSAHEKGIVHCDLKPGNIMITSSGGRRNAVVLDFGISSVVEEHRDIDYRTLTEEGTVRGTPAYMAPEQLHNDKVTPQTDIYAWGLVMLECLTGEAIYNYTSYAQVIFAQMSSDPVPIPDAIREHGLGQVVKRAVEKRVERRFQSAKQALDALNEVDLADLGEIGPAESSPPSGDRSTVDERSTSDPFGPTLTNDHSTPRVTVDESSRSSTEDIVAPERSRASVVVAAIVLLAAGAAGVWWFSQQGAAESSAATSKTTAEAAESVDEVAHDTESEKQASTPPDPERSEPLPETPTHPIPTILVPSARAEIGLTEDALARYQDTYVGNENGFDLDHSAGVLESQLWTRPALHVATTEVTWEQWQTHRDEVEALDALCDAPLPESGSGDHPAAGIGATEAAAFCTAIGMRLPTLREWEALARGGSGRPYGFVGELTGERAAELAEARPAGALDWNTTPEGIRDLSGSVFEWVSCSTDELPYCKDGVAFRGGSHAGDPLHHHAFVVPYIAEDPACLRRDDVGFRCVADVESGGAGAE